MLTLPLLHVTMSRVVVDRGEESRASGWNVTSLTLKQNEQLWISQSCIFLASVLTAVVTETIRDPGLPREFPFSLGAFP